VFKFYKQKSLLKLQTTEVVLILLVYHFLFLTFLRNCSTKPFLVFATKMATIVHMIANKLYERLNDEGILESEFPQNKITPG